MTNILLKKVTACLLEQLYQIECADDEQVNEDFSVSLMELVGAEFQTLEPDDLSEFLKMVSEMSASENDEGRREYLESFAKNFGLADGATST